VACVDGDEHAQEIVRNLLGGKVRIRIQVAGVSPRSLERNKTIVASQDQGREQNNVRLIGLRQTAPAPSRGVRRGPAKKPKDRLAPFHRTGSRMSPGNSGSLRLSGGTTLSFTTAGATSDPTVLLLHGFPSSARSFRDVIPVLSKTARVVAPDLPGFGDSDVLPSPSFDSLSGAVAELLEHLSVGPRYLYLHDFGAPVGFNIAMKMPEQVLGLMVQNANAHESGYGSAVDRDKGLLG